MSKLLTAMALTICAAVSNFSLQADQSASLVSGGTHCTGETTWIDCGGAFCGGYDDYTDTPETEDTVTMSPMSIHVCSGNYWCEDQYDFPGIGGCTRH